MSDKDDGIITSVIRSAFFEGVLYVVQESLDRFVGGSDFDIVSICPDGTAG